jgi:hypothetical protein
MAGKMKSRFEFMRPDLGNDLRHPKHGPRKLTVKIRHGAAGRL